MPAHVPAHTPMPMAVCISTRMLHTHVCARVDAHAMSNTLSMHMYMHTSVQMSMHMYMRMSIHKSTHMSMHMSVYVYALTTSRRDGQGGAARHVYTPWL